MKVSLTAALSDNIQIDILRATLSTTTLQRTSRNLIDMGTYGLGPHECEVGAETTGRPWTVSAIATIHSTCCQRQERSTALKGKQKSGQVKGLERAAYRVTLIEAEA